MNSTTLRAEDYLRRIRSSSVYNVAHKTPLEHAPLLSKLTGNDVWLKREDEQPVFSFKLRGAYNMMSRLSSEALSRGVITASAGNHAQGVGLAAKMLKAHAVIVVPCTTPQIKIEAILALGAELIVFGDGYDEAFEHARTLGAQRGLTFVHPYDHPDVIAGQGTIGLEIVEQRKGALDAVFVPVGGGGLISGIALAVKELRPGTKVIGVEAEDCDAMNRSLQAGHRVQLDRIGMLADGCAVRIVGEETFRIAREWVDEIVTVSNDEICGAVKEVFEDCRAVVEPAGALSYAGLKSWAAKENAENLSLVAVLSGANLNFERLRYIAERAEVGEGHEGILAIEIPERPGSFRELCADMGARNLTEFNYRMGDSRAATVFAGVQIRSARELDELVAVLRAKGYRTFDLTADEVAKTHVRHMVGGRSPDAEHERLLHFDFPERAGALSTFLDRLGTRWNISLFHYRNHGSDVGRALVGIQVPPESKADFERFLASVEYGWSDETSNPAIRMFLGG